MALDEGIVVSGSVGFVTFRCAVCRQTKLEVRDSSEVVAAYLGQSLLVCKECSQPQSPSTHTCGYCGEQYVPEDNPCVGCPYCGGV